MINSSELIQTFKKLSYENKKKKIIKIITAIHQKTNQFEDILLLLEKVEKVPEQMIVDLYTHIVEYGNDMNDIKIKEKIGETAYKLQLIWEEEAKDRVKEQEELLIMEKMILQQ